MAKKIHRIEKEFVLKDLMHSKAIINISYRTMRLRGRLTEYDKDTITISLVDKPETLRFEQKAQTSLFFRFRGVPITCMVAYIETALDSFIFTIPSAMYRDLARHYERVQLGDQISVTIIVDGKQLNINFPTSASYYDPEAHTQKNKIESLGVSDLLRAFRERCMSFSSKSNIVLFRGRKPSTIAERIVATSGKIVVLPFMDMEDCASLDPTISIIKLSDTDWIAAEAGESPTSLRSEIQKCIQAMGQQNIFHELYVPILYYEYVIGYIYLMRGELQQTAFQCKHLEMVYQFSRLFAHSLNVNGYFKTGPGRKKFTGSELIDISATGLLLSYPTKAPPVELYSEIDLVLNMQGQSLPVKGQIMRKVRNIGEVYLGVQFIAMSEANKDLLLRELYGDGYGEEMEIR